MAAVDGPLALRAGGPVRRRGGATAQTASTTAPDTTGGARLLWTLAGHTASPVSLAVSRDGTRALSGGGHGDGAVRVWDLERGQPVTRFTGHGDKSDIITVAFTPDGTAAISAAGPEDGSLRIWELASGRRTHPARRRHRPPVPRHLERRDPGAGPGDDRRRPQQGLLPLAAGRRAADRSASTRPTTPRRWPSRRTARRCSRAAATAR